MYTDALSLTLFNGKPFFMPWQSSDVPFDALLGLSLTLNTTRENPVVLLETYTKIPGKLSLSLSFEGEPLVSIEHFFTKGIEVIELPTSDLLLRGTLTVTDSAIVEMPKKLPLQLSPLYINTKSKASSYRNQSCFINDTQLYLNEFSMAGQGDIAAVRTGNVGTINIAAVEGMVSAPVTDTEYITHVNGKPVSSDGSAVVWLPSYFDISVGGDGAILNIIGNTQDTCPVYAVSAPTILLNYIKQAGYAEPFDSCGSGASFNPMLIDAMRFTDEGLRWDELSKRHE